MDSLGIELAEKADVKEALRFANWAAEHTVANFAVQPESLEDWEDDWETHHRTYPWLVARAPSGVVGFAKAGPFKLREAYAPSAEVTVYVDPLQHRKGIGRSLYDVLLPLLRDQGFARLVAGITTPHPASENLHLRYGFQRCATFHRIGWKFGAWRDVSFFELSLHAGDGPPPLRKSVEEAWSARQR
jgi:phosphinothricin acetyltransferase